MSVIERTEVVTVAVRGDEVPADGVATYSAILRNGGPGAPTRLTVPSVDGRPAGRLVVVWGDDPDDGRLWQLAREIGREAVYTPVPVPISMAGPGDWSVHRAA
ncbi:MAG: hypothetical protein BGO37_04090 [Cellulomonas sp. 73-92]|uniref:hypothetical protein n=1 Tax=Cellulomonas sp. 73-92 TaxID=1895740 RepID=UPI000925BC91|nr:hypothetical protein [Cellulomonas sp. 73-92]OJV82180.1 MAG: hypothetical protein BGO37_04090 [Cellulomonas sp. 73-92]